MKLKPILTLVLILFVSLSGIGAFQLEPIIQDFYPSGVNSRRNFQLINPGENPVAVKVSMVYRDMDLYGTETLTDASDLFFVYPSQVIIQPQSTQTVRVQWLGNPEVSIEQSFRIIAEQLPINMNQERSGVNILIAYHGSIYVVPDTFSFGIDVVSLAKHRDEQGNDILQIELVNTGNTHAILRNPVIEITNSSTITKNKITLTADKLEGLANMNILAGSNRVFSVPWPEGLLNGNLNATLKVDTER